MTTVYSFQLDKTSFRFSVYGFQLNISEDEKQTTVNEKQ